jgi:hypothetical protein
LKSRIHPLLTEMLFFIIRVLFSFVFS